MPTVILVRHGRSSSNTSGTLAGRTPGVKLDETGVQQADAVAQRLAGLPLAAIVTSPLERCRQTAAAIAKQHPGLRPATDRRLTECGYGDWTGQKIATLAKDPLWAVVQAHPSSVTFPNGESMRAMQQRGVDAIRAHNAALPDDAIWVAVSHGDVIKAIVADALGQHLDTFQRIVVDTASTTIITYTQTRPFLVRLNDTGSELASLIPKPAAKGKKQSSDAVVGGR
ncbi:MSMEG_4193 family putative phosphomutase [Kribbella sandramycini]|uniref:MSMEG_4193 family putative phosphomutase n=1 Tax=Kribbella sandramycini TaxID=60450 RepID=A0A7Y4NZY7_9ACTN|nr:histidine phosphatase family protein [Kribbella sandramycini]MBB6569601.1 putative phosphomutase (TIGR03848 family) [Kribbella sandramycini]NOL40565.1 MSMEG_4193 family putative phosphomutase [Kribbella sandramycini]